MRKGQITSYIILGILMLIGFVLVFSTTLKDRVVDVKSITYPDEVQPITEFITQCVQTKGTEAIELALSQGGFVEIPPFIQHESNAHLALDEYGLGILPYWTVPGEERIPPLELTRSQLTKYVQEHSLECFDSFSDFSEEYQVIPQGNLAIDANIGEKDVVFQAAYPIKILHKATNQEFTTERYVSFIPIRYKKLYDLATKVMQFENRNSVIENVTMTMVLSDPDIPTNGMLVDCGGKSWRLQDIKEKLQMHMGTALQTLRIKNTDHPPFAMDRSVYEGLRRSKQRMWKDLENGLENIQDSPNYPAFTPPDTWSYFNTYYDIGAQKSEMIVSMDYNPSYGMMINGQPSSGGKLNTKLMTGASKWLQFICINGYHFTYDIMYPVRVAIRDPLSNFGQGAVFEYAFQVLIDNNEPSRMGITPTYFPITEPEVDYCDAFGETIVDLRATGYTLEGLAPTELKGVQMESLCVNKVCRLGTTSAQEGVYRLKTAIPVCVNPTIRATMEGYLPAEATLKGTQLTLDLRKTRNMSFQVVKQRYDLIEQVLGEPMLLDEGDQVSIFMASDENKLTQFRLYPQENTIEIVDDTATYDLRIIIRNDDKTLGGYLAENITIPFNDIAGTDRMVFKVIEYHPTPDDKDSETQMAIHLGGMGYTQELRPIFG